MISIDDMPPVPCLRIAPVLAISSEYGRRSSSGAYLSSPLGLCPRHAVRFRRCSAAGDPESNRPRPQRNCRSTISSAFRSLRCFCRCRVDTPCSVSSGRSRRSIAQTPCIMECEFARGECVSHLSTKEAESASYSTFTYINGSLNTCSVCGTSRSSTASVNSSEGNSSSCENNSCGNCGEKLVHRCLQDSTSTKTVYPRSTGVVERCIVGHEY